MLQNVGESFLLIPIGKKVMDLNGLLTLNSTAVFLWELLDEDKSLIQLSELLSKRYGLDIDTALIDVKNFIDRISAFGAIVD